MVFNVTFNNISVISCWSVLLEWSRSYGSWIYNYLCNQCLSPLKLRVWTTFMAGSTWYNIMWYSLSVICDRSVVFSWYYGFLQYMYMYKNSPKNCHNLWSFFSSPDPKGHVRYCHHLASVVRPLTSSYFNLLLWNNLAKWNQTWQKVSI
jgi:hypothetical protein